MVPTYDPHEIEGRSRFRRPRSCPRGRHSQRPIA